MRIALLLILIAILVGCGDRTGNEENEILELLPIEKREAFKALTPDEKRDVVRQVEQAEQRAIERRNWCGERGITEDEYYLALERWAAKHPEEFFAAGPFWDYVKRLEEAEVRRVFWPDSD